MSGSNGNGNGHRDYILLTAETRRARKLYRCVHCTEKISPGEPHVYTSGVYDGSICDDRWHLECRDAVEREFRDRDKEWEMWEPGAYRRGTVNRSFGSSSKIR